MAELHKFDYEKNLIPEISKEEIKRRAKLVFPCTIKERELILMKDCGNPITQSFSWNFKEDKTLGNISFEGISVRDKPAPGGGWFCKTIAKKVGEFLTLHEFAYYGFFKPSIGEIVSQLPSELFDEKKLAGRKIYITNKMISDDVNTAMLNQTWHIAKTIVYIEKIEE
jgi:hypothetical protein